MRYKGDFCSMNVKHRVLACVSGSLLSKRTVAGLPNSLVGLARVRIHVPEKKKKKSVSRN